MKAGFRQSMALLHSWAGLLPGWLVFAIFLFGTTAFFQNEINHWMRPELPQAAAASRQALEAADRLLRERAAGAASWAVSLPSLRGGQGVTVSWRAPGAGRRDATEVVLDPTSGREIAVRDTRGGYFLYRFHFDLHYMPVLWSRYLVGVAAAGMLLAILSGVITHKKVFTDFFLLRLGKGQRSWLDAHNVSAVLTLPFFLMITYTGLVTLQFMLMPWAIAANYPSEGAFYEAAFPRAPETEPLGRSMPIAPLTLLADRAAQARNGAGPNYILIDRPGDASATATLYPQQEAWGDTRDPLILNATNAERLPVPSNDGGAAATQRVMVDLHRGWFAALLRWLYFLSGVGGTLMIATGLVLWTVKRRAKLPDPQRPYFGFRLVERLNIGVVVGAPLGIAAYFLANRLLPAAMTSRAEWEINILFIAWGAVLAWTMGRPSRRGWIESLWLCAAAYAVIPLVSGATTGRWLTDSLLRGDWVFVGFDLTMFATAAACALAAVKTTAHKPKLPARRKPTPKAAT